MLSRKEINDGLNKLGSKKIRKIAEKSKHSKAVRKMWDDVANSLK